VRYRGAGKDLVVDIWLVPFLRVVIAADGLDVYFGIWCSTDDKLNRAYA
jgi:hypothetical protein